MTCTGASGAELKVEKKKRKKRKAEDAVVPEVLPLLTNPLICGLEQPQHLELLSVSSSPNLVALANNMAPSIAVRLHLHSPVENVPVLLHNNIKQK